MWGEQMRRGYISACGVTLMLARCLIVSIVLMLPAPSEAASLFSNFEYRSFWRDVLPLILIATVVIFVTWQLRKKIRRQSASAPPEAFRSPQQKRLYRLSLLFITAPMLYAILFEVDLMLPLGAMLVAPSLGLIALRILGLTGGWRLFSILPVSLLSMLAGTFAIAWWASTLWPTGDQALVLIISAVCFALGNLLSYQAFPPAYRHRVW